MLLACMGTVMAEASVYQEETAAASLIVPQRIWEIGPEISRIKYEEPGVMKQEGVMYGIDISHTYHSGGVAPVETDEGFEREMETSYGSMFRGDIRFSNGQVDYDGSLQDGTPYKQDDIDDNMFEVRGLAGADLFTSSSLATAYIGVGYRYLNDDSSADPTGYERESNYVYMPLGVEAAFANNNGWVIGGTLEYDLFLWGHQKSDLTDFGEGVIENDQDSGYGFRASLRFQKDNFIIEPFFRYWDIDESDVDRGWVEPANESTEYGVKFIWRF